MFIRRKQEIVVSETDIEAALSHLRSLPYRDLMPVSWDRLRLLSQLNEAIGRNPKIDEYHGIAPGLFAIIKPFGVDLMSHGEPDGRLQVWLLIRPCGTDPTRVVSLSMGEVQ
ncbi:hypothetical protein [Enterobacter cancerogenus]|nr:hypothetical protein [Salmonella enterica]ECH4042282.1 hypothetical protein [Salmonella enterica]